MQIFMMRGGKMLGCFFYTENVRCLESAARHGAETDMIVPFKRFLDRIMNYECTGNGGILLST